MGYQIASIVLRDGTRFDHVMIVGGVVTEIAGIKEIPFTEAEIVEIHVTHGK